MRIVDSYLKKPHLVTSLVLLAAVIGFVGYRQMPVNLFPDSERPQIAVVTVYPGASSQDVEADVSRTVEKELGTIEQVRRVTSVSKDEVSTVMVEFEYSKGLDSAATDVANGLQKIKAQLPPAVRPPMIFKVSSATPAVMTLALRPKKGSPLDLSMVRQIADNQIKERLLQLPEVANVEVFGAHQPVVRVELDRDKLERFGLTPGAVRERLIAFNANQPVGLLITSEAQFLLKRTGELERPGRRRRDHRGPPAGRRRPPRRRGAHPPRRARAAERLPRQRRAGDRGQRPALHRGQGPADDRRHERGAARARSHLPGARDHRSGHPGHPHRALRRQHARRPARRRHHDGAGDLPVPGRPARNDPRRDLDSVHLPADLRGHVADRLRVQHGDADRGDHRRRHAARRRHRGAGEHRASLPRGRRRRATRRSSAAPRR